jgi:hypothetical protein
MSGAHTDGPAAQDESAITRTANRAIDLHMEGLPLLLMTRDVGCGFRTFFVRK